MDEVMDEGQAQMEDDADQEPEIVDEEEQAMD